MKTIKLPNALTIAIGQYFIGRSLATPHLTGQSWNGGAHRYLFAAQQWDKEGALKRIRYSLPRGWGYQACAGTFWIFKAGNKKTHYYIHEKNWPLAEIRPNKT